MKVERPAAAPARDVPYPISAAEIQDGWDTLLCKCCASARQCAGAFNHMAVWWRVWVPWLSLAASLGWVAVYVATAQTERGHAQWPHTAAALLHTHHGKHLVPYAGLLLPLAGASALTPPSRAIYTITASLPPPPRHSGFEPPASLDSTRSTHTHTHTHTHAH